MARVSNEGLVMKLSCCSDRGLAVGANVSVIVNVLVALEVEVVLAGMVALHVPVR